MLCGKVPEFCQIMCGTLNLSWDLYCIWYGMGGRKKTAELTCFSSAAFSMRHPPRRHNDCITKNLGVVKRVQGRAPEEAMVALALDNEFFRILTLQTTQPAAWYWWTTYLHTYLQVYIYKYVGSLIFAAPSITALPQSWASQKCRL